VQTAALETYWIDRGAERRNSRLVAIYHDSSEQKGKDWPARAEKLMAGTTEFGRLIWADNLFAPKGPVIADAALPLPRSA
jgi:hypothetical protein